MGLGRYVVSERSNSLTDNRFIRILSEDEGHGYRYFVFQVGISVHFGHVGEPGRPRIKE